VPIAGTAKSADKIVSELDGPGKLVAGDFESRNFLVVTDAKTAKPKTPHRTFSLCNLPELFNCYGIAVREAGRETSNRRLVPGPQSQGLRKQADLRFGQPYLLQWAAHAQVPRGTHPGSEIVKIIQVRSINNMSQSARLGEILEPGVKLRLAEETTLVRIVRIARIGELSRVDKDVLSAYFARDDAGFIHLLASVGLRQAGRGQSAGTECTMRDLEEITTIDSSREGN